MSKERFKAGIIGLGNIGARYTGPGDPKAFCHAGGIELCDGIEVAAVADDLAQNRETYCRTWGEAPAFESGEEMLRQAKLDVVAVCTPAMTHTRLILAAVEAGVPVIFAEKPLATSLAEIDEINRRADAAGSLIVVSHTRHWDPPLVHAARLVRRDRIIGDIQAITSTCGGPVLTMAIHGLDLLCQFADSDPSAVFGYTGPIERHPESGLLEQAVLQGAVALFQGGTVGYVRGQDGPNEIFTVDVIGSEGVLRTGFNRDVEIRDKQGALLDAAALGVPARESPFKAAYDEIVRYLRGGEAPQCTSRDCMPSYELAFGILESALSGCRIALPCRNRDRRFYAFRMPGLRPTTERNN